MRDRVAFLRIVLLTNGIVDLLCAAALLILPRLSALPFGYNTFDAQGAFMAGGWGISSLALGVTRIYASTRPETYHAILVCAVKEWRNALARRRPGCSLPEWGTYAQRS